MSKIEVWVKDKTRPAETENLYHITYSDGKNQYLQTAFFDKENDMWRSSSGTCKVIPWQQNIFWLDTEAITVLEQENARMREALEKLTDWKQLDEMSNIEIAKIASFALN